MYTIKTKVLSDLIWYDLGTEKERCQSYQVEAFVEVVGPENDFNVFSVSVFDEETKKTVCLNCLPFQIAEQIRAQVEGEIVSNSHEILESKSEDL